MKILLLGKSGMLGSCFLKNFFSNLDFELYAFSKEDLDVTNTVLLKELFKKISPTFVVNCSAYTAVDDCEINKELAFNINGRAPGEIAKICKELNCCLVHFSTDYVFNGKKAEGYNENDSTDPINIYGESKLIGEDLIKENMDKYYIIRISWLFGENGKNFVDSMINLGKTKDTIDVVSDQIGSPTYTRDLCKAIESFFILPNMPEFEHNHEYSLRTGDLEIHKKLPFGIYHLTNFGQTSWYDFAKKIFEIMKMNVSVKETTSEKFKRPAKRPSFSTLLNTKTDIRLRRWEEALKAYLNINYNC